MIKNIFILPVLLLLPSVTDAGDCVAVSLYCTGSEAAFSISHPENPLGETADFVSRHIKLISTLKLKKNIPGSSNRSFYGSPVQFVRPAKNLAPTKTITGRIPSSYPTNVLRI
jgi:hypothetical protein